MMKTLPPTTSTRSIRATSSFLGMAAGAGYQDKLVSTVSSETLMLGILKVQAIGVFLNTSPFGRGRAFGAGEGARFPARCSRPHPTLADSRRPLPRGEVNRFLLFYPRRCHPSGYRVDCRWEGEVGPRDVVGGEVADFGCLVRK